jgi:hypothetical protein
MYLQVQLSSITFADHKTPFFVTSSQVPVEAYNLCTPGDDDKEKTKHTPAACLSLRA